MPRTPFNLLRAGSVNHFKYLCKGLQSDATERMGISPLLKAICALRKFLYCLPTNISEDIFDLSDTISALCLELFYSAVTVAFGDVYLRNPTPDDIVRIEAEFRAPSFPVCIRFLYFSCLAWKLPEGASGDNVR